MSSTRRCTYTGDSDRNCSHEDEEAEDPSVFVVKGVYAHDHDGCDAFDMSRVHATMLTSSDDLEYCNHDLVAKM